jgi:hypothetical protein
MYKENRPMPDGNCQKFTEEILEETLRVIRGYGASGVLQSTVRNRLRRMGSAVVDAALYELCKRGKIKTALTGRSYNMRAARRFTAVFEAMNPLPHAPHQLAKHPLSDRVIKAVTAIGEPAPLSVIVNRLRPSNVEDVQNAVSDLIKRGVIEAYPPRKYTFTGKGRVRARVNSKVVFGLMKWVKS